MLKLVIPSVEMYDEEKSEFITTKGQTLSLEHSLVSLSKWESKWKKPFLTKEEKPMAETIDYIRRMTTTQNVDPEVYNNITQSNLEAVRSYIEDDMTATTFNQTEKTGGRKEIVTAELIYYWMIALHIPFECQKWHLNRLLTLINVCNIKSTPPKKRSKREIMSRNAAINAARRKAMNSEG